MPSTRTHREPGTASASSYPPTRAQLAGAALQAAFGRHACATLAGCNLLCGLLFSAMFALVMPPFQNADETAHVFKAAQVASGQVIGHTIAGGTSGGELDSGIAAAMQPFLPVRFHQDVKVTPALTAAAAGIGWTGHLQPAAFPNTAIYSPVLYAPGAAALWLGRAFHRTILQSLTFARLANALVAAGLGTAGIVLAGRAASLLFTVLTLPMSLALMANASQDGLMLGCCTLAAGLACTARDRSVPPRWLLPVLTVALGAACLARPPYLPFAILPFLIPAVPRWQRAAAVLAIVTATLAWSAFAATHAVADLRPGHPETNAGAQLRWMADHPRALVPILWRSLHDNAPGLLDGFVGRLGSLDVPLPWAYVALAAAVVTVAAALSAGSPRGAPGGAGPAACLVAAALASVLLIHLVQYVTWTEVGAPIVTGIQGRYLTPVVLLLTPALAALPVRRAPASRGRCLAIAGLALFPVLSTGIVVRALMERYYS